MTAGRSRTFAQFSKAVNALAQKHCNFLNARYEAGRALFGARHYTYPDEMLAYYFNGNYTPEAAFYEIRTSQ